MTEKGDNKLLSGQDAALQEFINIGIDRTKVASMIYIINQNNRKGIGFTGENSSEVILKPCCYTLILDLKILVQFSLLSSLTLKFTVFSTVLQTHIVLLLSPILLHLKPSKVFSCITSHLKGSLRPLHISCILFHHFLHKIIQKGILVISCSGTHF